MKDNNQLDITKLDFYFDYFNEILVYLICYFLNNLFQN